MPILDEPSDRFERYLIQESQPMIEKIIKFGDVTEDYSLRVYLLPRHVPKGMDPKVRNKARVHSEVSDIDYYPFIFYRMSDGEKRIKAADIKGYFDLGDPENNWATGEFKEDPLFHFKISDSIFEEAENLKVDEDFLVRFKKANSDGFSLFLQMRKAFLYYADIEDWTASMLSLWVMSTFIYQTFSAFPYVFLLAERGSGKSRVLKIISHLSNAGQYWISARISPIFRTVEALKPTLVLDEIEWMNNEKNPDSQEMLNLLNSGYERGGFVVRTNMDNKGKRDRFEAYCPKAIASTEEISGIMTTRCLRGPIRRTMDQSFVTRDPMEDIPFLKSIQEDLLFWSIEHASDIARVDRTAVLEKYRQNFAGAPARILQIMLPLLVVFEYLKGPGEMTDMRAAEVAVIEKHIIKIIEYQSRESKSASTDDSTVKILIALNNCIENYRKTPIWPGIMNNEVRNNLEEDLDHEEDIRFFTPKKIGKVLSKFDVEKRYMDGKPQYFGGVGWSYDRASKFMDDLLKRYSIDTAQAVADRDEQDRLKEKME